MPIRPENKGRYPRDWKTISAAIRERSGGRCECEGECGLHRTTPGPRRCVERHGEPAKWAKGKVVLTVAHLGSPAHAPVQLHVTGTAEADEIVQVVGFFMPLDPEGSEWAHMMHGRLLAEFFGGARTVSAPIAIAFPGGRARRRPRGAVSHQALSVPPEYAILSSWRLLGEPLQPAIVPAESPARPQMPAAHLESLAASFADAIAEASFRSAQCFIATGRRAGLDEIGSLLRGDAERFLAHTATLLADAASRRTADAGALYAASHGGIDGGGAFGGAGLPRSGRDVRKGSGTARAMNGRGAFARSSHTGILFHFSEYPENCDPNNLKAMCQRCHLRYDVEHHKRTAYATRRRGRAARDLFA